MSSSELDLYEGRVVVVRLDPDRLEDINSFLEPYVNDLKPGERIHTSIKGDVLTVRFLQRRAVEDCV